MDSNGDYLTMYAGVGQETAPSIAFGAEPSTGVYLASPGSSSAYTISKRGTKRLRIDDDKTEIFGPLISEGIIIEGPIVLPDGSASSPSLSFETSTSTGLYHTYDGKDHSSEVVSTVIDGKSFWDVTSTGASSDGNISCGILQVDEGSTLVPSITGLYNGTGLYFPPQEIVLATNNRDIIKVTDTGAYFNDGAIASPSIGFSSGATSGFSFASSPSVVSTSIDTKAVFKVRASGTLTTGITSSDYYNSNGTTSASSLSYSGSGNQGIWFPSSSQVGVAASSTNLMTFGTDSVMSTVALGSSTLTPLKIVQSDSKSQLVSSTSAVSDLLPSAALFGDGSDGNVTISANTTLTHDMFYDTLTVNSGATLSTAGFRIYCKTALNGDGTGIIAFNGNNASGQTAGTGVTNATNIAFGTSQAGGLGGAINTVGSTALPGTGPGGQGGRGGDSATRAAGAQNNTTFSTTTASYFKNPFFGPGVGASGGASGSGGGGGATGTGGGGGAGGGRVFVAAASFTGTGGIISIRATGGNGGSASDGTGGIGAGGGGGFVYVVTRNVGTWVAASQISVAAGAPGVTGLTTNSLTASAGTYVVVTI